MIQDINLVQFIAENQEFITLNTSSETYVQFSCNPGEYIIISVATVRNTNAAPHGYGYVSNKDGKHYEFPQDRAAAAGKDVYVNCMKGAIIPIYLKPGDYIQLRDDNATAGNAIEGHLCIVRVPFKGD